MGLLSGDTSESLNQYWRYVTETATLPSYAKAALGMMAWCGKRIRNSVFHFRRYNSDQRTLLCIRLDEYKSGQSNCTQTVNGFRSFVVCCTSISAITAILGTTDRSLAVLSVCKI
jgi:hypothetical protein